MVIPGCATQSLQKHIYHLGGRTHLLDLSNLGLTDLPTPEDLLHGGKTQLPDLDLIDISHNRIRQLPAWVFSASRAVIASHNRIQDLPDSIGEARTLEYLDLSNNKLYILPRPIARLTTLTHLYLHNNFLDLPPEILGAYPFLPPLYIRIFSDSGALETHQDAYLIHKIYQSLAAAPVSDLRSENPHLLNLRDFLETLVRGPKESAQPPDIDLARTILRSTLYIKPAAKKRDPAEILSYYFRVREGKRPLNEAKLILVGFGAVGKTSLVTRLVCNYFDKREKKTEGIAITGWPIKLANDHIRLHVWDFGGQEIMHATHQFFLTTRSLYLLVLSGRQGREDSDAEYWLNVIEGLCGQSPVIVVLNKVREHPFTINRTGLSATFPQIRGFIETDCEAEIGITKLKNMIFRAINELEHLRDAFPSAWFDIKNRIAGMEENYLTFDRFRAICAQLGENDRKAHDELALYLHSLGILNYKDDPRLRDTHVLNPQWVTKGIYALINSSVIAARNGEMLVGDLSEILDIEYPPERHGFLIELMRKFELCVPFDEANRYLIPELLDRDEPSIAIKMGARATLRFQYH